LPAIYAGTGRNLVIRASRQVEKSTYLVNTIIHEACTKPGISILFVTARMEQVGTFTHTRLLPAIEESPLIRRRLLGRGKPKMAVSRMRFANGSQLYARAAFHSADAARGLSCQMLLIDEFQDIAAGDLPVLQEVMSHARNGRTILTGTPKSVDNHLEAMFRLSTANEWTVDCLACGKPVIMDERALGPRGIACLDCQAPLDPQQGRWVARHPQATWGDGFWINHTMVPWLNYDEILDRQRTYDPVRFKNEVIGLPTTLGEHVVTRAELEACCHDVAMAASFDAIRPDAHRHLVAGIDWGGGAHSRTVVTIGYMRSDFAFQILRFDMFAAREDPQRVLTEVASLCRRFHIRFIGADGGGNGHVYNRMLVDKLGHECGLYALLYSSVEHEPARDGILWKWTVNRSATIGTLFARVKKGLLRFPRIQDCGSYLDEFACVVAEYDDHLRSVCYSHPETLPDDAMHACNYALILGIFESHARHRFDG
jgi:hypothetical protein